MENREKIAQLFTAFHEGDLDKSRTIAERIIKNFSIDSDEFYFEIDCAVYKPHEKAATELEKVGTPELIADNPMDRALVKHTHAVKCRIYAKDLMADSLSTVITINLDGEGIKSVTASPRTDKEQAKEIVECWLIREFGTQMHW